MSDCKTCAEYDGDKGYCPKYCEVIRKTFGELTPEELCDLVCGTAEEEERMPEEYENAIEWLDGQKTATVTLHSQKLRNRVLKLAKEHPDKVTIIARPEDKGQNGILYARIPISWIQIRPPRKLELTAEQRKTLSENGKRTISGARAARKPSKIDAQLHSDAPTLRSKPSDDIIYA